MPPVFIEGLLKVQSGAAPPDDADLRRFLDEAAAHSAGGIPVTAARLDRCLDALEEIDRNANQATLIEAWLDALAAA